MTTQSALPSRVREASLPEEVERGPIRIHTPSLRPVSFAEPTATAGAKPLDCLKYRWVTVVFLGGSLAFALAFTAYSLIPAKYTTNSLVRVFSDSPVVHQGENAQVRGDFNIYLKSQAAMIKSHFVLNAALRDPNVAALPMLRAQADPVRYLEEELKVESTEGSEILKISLSGDDPQAIAKIVNSIQEAYFHEVVDEEVLRKKTRLKQLEDAIARLQEDITRRAILIKGNNSANPAGDLIPGPLAINQFLSLKERLGKLENEIANWEAEKNGTGKKLANVAAEVSPPVGFFESLDKDPKMMTLVRRIDQYNQKIEFITKASGGNLPSIDEMKKKVAELQEEVEQFKRDKMAELMKSQQPLMEKKLKDDLERSTTNLALLASQKKKLEAEIDEYQKQISKNGGAGGANWDFPLLEVDERTKMITSMIDKANLLRLEVNAPPRVADLQRAAVPMKRDLKKQLLGTIMAGLMGFGLVSFGVIVTESRVRRAMTLADVQKNVICPIAGVLPTRSGKKGTADGIGETMEKARINLLQQFARPGSKVIAVTSSLTEEGKAYLAWQLAESFSQAGSRTLLVDFDLRTPSLHREMQVDNERGVCDILLGKAELADFLRPALVSPYGGELEDGSASAAVPDDGPMAEPVDEGSVEASQDLQLIAIANPARYGNALTFLPAGKWTPEVRAGLNPERLEGILQSLRFQFDVVILNTHPLLEVAETFVLCRNSDAVLLSVERHESRVPLVARSHEKLASAGTEVLGIVYQGASSEECLN